MNHAKKKQIKGMLTSLVIAMMLTASCGNGLSDNTVVSKNKSTEESINRNDEDNKILETEIPDEIQNLLDLGTYEGNIAINGEDRDEAEIKLSNDYCIFPQCSVRTMIANTIGTEQTFVNISKNEVKKLVSLVEKTQIQNDNTTFNEMNINPDEFSLDATLQLILLNSNGEYKKLSLVAFKGNTVKIRLDGEEYSLMPNKELTKTIKKLTNYRILEDNDLAELTEIEIFYNKSGKSYTLNSEEVKDIINGLKSRERIHEFTDSDAYVIAKTSNGESVSMKISERGKQVAIEGAAYAVQDEVIKTLMKGQ